MEDVEVKQWINMEVPKVRRLSNSEIECALDKNQIRTKMLIANTELCLQSYLQNKFQFEPLIHPAKLTALRFQHKGLNFIRAIMNYLEGLEGTLSCDESCHMILNAVGRFAGPFMNEEYQRTLDLSFQGNVTRFVNEMTMKMTISRLNTKGISEYDRFDKTLLIVLGRTLVSGHVLGKYNAFEYPLQLAETVLVVMEGLSTVFLNVDTELNEFSTKIVEHYTDPWINQQLWRINCSLERQNASQFHLDLLAREHISGWLRNSYSDLLAREHISGWLRNSYSGMGQQPSVWVHAPKRNYYSTGYGRYQERTNLCIQFGIRHKSDIKKRFNKKWTTTKSKYSTSILYETIKNIEKSTEEAICFGHVLDQDYETVMSDGFVDSHFGKKSLKGTPSMFIRTMSQRQSISSENGPNKRSIYVGGGSIVDPGIFDTSEGKGRRIMNPRLKEMFIEYFQNIKTINTAFLRSQGITMEHFERIKKYCNEILQCVEVHSSSLPQVDMSMLKMQSMEMVKIAFDLQSSQFQASHHLSSVDGNISAFGKMNRKNKVSLDQKKTTYGMEQDNRYFSKRKLIQCQMCIDHNEALHWCNTCRRNICDFCKLYHEKVWIVKHHDVQSFQF